MADYLNTLERKDVAVKAISEICSDYYDITRLTWYAVRSGQFINIEALTEYILGLYSDKSTVRQDIAEKILLSGATTASKVKLLQRIRVLAIENAKLVNKHMCKCCRKVILSGNTGVTFLPCGHYSVCCRCEEMFDDCPICGKNIIAVVNTFLA